MFDLSFENILHSNFINFLILLGIIIFLVLKIDVKKIVETKRKSVENTVKNADIENNSSKLNLKNAQKEVEDIPVKLKEIEETAKDSLHTMEEKLKFEAQKQLSSIEKNIEKVIESESSKVNLMLSKGVSTASLRLAEDNIKNQLETNPELHKKFINQAIDELENVNL